MRGNSVSIQLFMKMLLAASMAWASVTSLRAETVEVQAVLATDAGKSGAVPPALAKFKAALAAVQYMTFADAGTQKLNFTAAVPKAAAQVGAFTLEVTRQGGAKFDVMVKEGAKTVYGPLTYTYTKEKTKQIELPTAKGAYIVFLTLEKE